MKRSLMAVVEAAEPVPAEMNDINVTIKGNLANIFGRALSLVFDKEKPFVSHGAVDASEPAQTQAPAVEGMANNFLFGQIQEQIEESVASNLIIYTVDENNLDDVQVEQITTAMPEAGSDNDFMLVMASPNDMPVIDDDSMRRINALEAMVIKAGYKVVSKRTV